MPNTWIEKLQASNGRLYKEKVIASAYTAHMLGNTDASTFLRCVQYALDPFATCGIKKVPITVGRTEQKNDWNHKAFWHENWKKSNLQRSKIGLKK